MRIAVIGAGGGDLDKAYEAVRQLYARQKIRVDLLICCGDLQPCRDEEDLEQVPTDPDWKSMRDFHKYYTGKKLAPVTTIFVGGRNEPANFLREMYYGGWVAPRIYYLGYAGVVRCGSVRIAGLSGTFKGQDYFRGHYESPPFTELTRMTALNTRECDVARLESVTGPVDIVVSYDWPRGIWKHGDLDDMLNKDLKGNLKMEIDSNTVGSPAAMDVLNKLRPAFWFSARPNMKFAALVPHDDGTFTRFLGLDRVAPWKEYLQVLDVDPRSPSCLRKLDGRRAAHWKPGGRPAGQPVHLDYDPEWLAIHKVNHPHLRLSWENAKSTVLQPSKEDVAWVARRLREGLKDGPRKRKMARRHQSLLPMKLREHGGGATFRDLPTAQLRELFEARGLEFPGHLDKASLVRQLEEHDEFFAAERGDAGVDLPDESYPIPEDFAATPENPVEQRQALLRLLELDDFLSAQEAQEPQKPKTAEPEIVSALKEANAGSMDAAPAAVTARDIGAEASAGTQPTIIVLDDAAEPEGAEGALPELVIATAEVAQSTAGEEAEATAPAEAEGQGDAPDDADPGQLPDRAATAAGEVDVSADLPDECAECAVEMGADEASAAENHALAAAADADDDRGDAAADADAADNSLAVSDIYAEVAEHEEEVADESVPANADRDGSVEEAQEGAVVETSAGASPDAVVIGAGAEEVEDGGVAGGGEVVERSAGIENEMEQEVAQEVEEEVAQDVVQNVEKELNQEAEQEVAQEVEQEVPHDESGVDDANLGTGNVVEAEVEADTVPVATEIGEVDPEVIDLFGTVAEVDPFMLETAEECTAEVLFPDEEQEPLTDLAEDDPYAVIDPYEDFALEDPDEAEAIAYVDEPPTKSRRVE